MEKRLFITSSPSETQNLGKRIGEKLSPGSIIALTGELGCGKTCFTKGLCSGLGIPKKEVNSPSFTLANEYKGKLPVFHLDLYRIDGMDASLDMGLSDYLLRAESGVAVIEWAESIISLLPDNYLAANFSVISPKKRQIMFTAFGERFSNLLDVLDYENP